MANLKELLAGKYLTGKEMQGREATVTLISITEEEMPGREDGGKPERKWVAWFEGKQKGLVLNHTNMQTLSDLGIEDTETIPDHFPELTLYSAITNFGPGIRIRAAATQANDMVF